MDKEEIDSLLYQILRDAQTIRMFQVKSETGASADRAWQSFNLAHKRLYEIWIGFQN
jgi:hypothetical protein